MEDKVNLAAKLAAFDERFSPKIVGELNDYKLALVKAKGEFVWHSHPDTDDFFLAGARLLSARCAHVAKPLVEPRTRPDTPSALTLHTREVAGWTQPAANAGRSWSRSVAPVVLARRPTSNAPRAASADRAARRVTSGALVRLGVG